MHIVRDIFIYEDTNLSIIKHGNDIWFKGHATANILKFANPRKAIRDHVDSEDKTRGKIRSP